jgi:type II secretory pathway pseudopilin PulG
LASGERVRRSSADVKLRRSALTLVEIILVLSLLVIIAAVSAPLLSGSMSRARLGHGGEMLRTAWGRARLAAMQSGETYVFRYESEGSRYQINSLSSLTTPGAAAVEASLIAEPEEVEDIDIFRQSQDILPQGIVFSAGQLAAVPQLAAAAVSTDGGWSAPILFYADGSTSDAVILLANDRQATLRVTLRGMTGISRASEIGAEGTP